MTIKNRIEDGKGLGYEAHVTSENAILTTQYGCPPLLPQKNKIFSQFLTDDGTSTGSNDMLVNASLAAPQDFWVEADDDNDIYITVLSIVLGDGGANLNEFCGVTALTNGCQLFYEDTDGDRVFIGDGLKSNWDFIRMCFVTPAFGDGASALRLTNVEGGAEAYTPWLNLLQIMPPYGLKLDRKTNQRITIRIRDNCSVPDVFNCKAYGFERFE